MTMVSSDLTPLMRQYAAIKQQYCDALLFFQVGDFYELFFDDAKTASAFLGIALTKRGKVNGDPIPLCGVPVHALDHYLTKLIKGGFKVALCQQLEEPKPGKVVDRGVTQVLTPGTLVDSKLLDEKSASYLFSFFPTETDCALVFAELLTAQLFATVIPSQANKSLEAELIRFFPDEIIIPDSKIAKPFDLYFKKMGYCTSVRQAPEQPELAQQWMRDQFPKAQQADISNSLAMQQALTYFYAYMRHTQESSLEHFKTLNWYAPEDFLILDRATQTNLELVRNTNDGSSKYSLFATLDGAMTAMGSRMIKKWIVRPLVKLQPIVQRQDVLELCMNNIMLMQQLEKVLSEISDIERVIGRISLRRATLHDFVHLKNVLQLIPHLMHLLSPHQSTTLIAVIVQHIISFDTLSTLLNAALNDDASKSWMIKAGFDQELDRLRELALQGSEKIIALEQQEQLATGINSLKIRYNTVQGYYIEVTKTHAQAIPERYLRQQTLVGRERYMTPELQQLQADILHAQAQMDSFEKSVFERVKQEVLLQISPLRKMAYALAHLDALLGLARISYEHQYKRPTFSEHHSLVIHAGRHPVVERTVDSFIPNDTHLHQEQSTWIITGPNMGGKSTYLRQVALMSIMAQIGCFVPAQSAQLALLDRVFTRIGAGDNLSQGQSTFLVEMQETAAILAYATSRSLVILDEVGRGTSTFDGLAIAQAVLEHIHTQIKARCLFATHYHELTQLEKTFTGIASYQAACVKKKDGIQFLYKITRGTADGSFGVEVAKIAQLPTCVVERAQELVYELTSEMRVQPALPLVSAQDNSELLQLRAQYEILHKKLRLLESVDFDNLSPKQALDMIWKMREI